MNLCGKPVRILPMGQIEQFNHLTVCKQISNVEQNYYFWIAILENI